VGHKKRKKFFTKFPFLRAGCSTWRDKGILELKSPSRGGLSVNTGTYFAFLLHTKGFIFYLLFFRFLVFKNLSLGLDPNSPKILDSDWINLNLQHSFSQTFTRR
jgi:hypothetical protein